MKMDAYRANKGIIYPGGTYKILVLREMIKTVTGYLLFISALLAKMKSSFSNAL